MAKNDGMITTPEPIPFNPMIYPAIRAVMKEIGAIGKTSKNTQQGFMFRGIDAVMNAINPALINNGVFIVPEILEQTREERQTKSGNNLIYSVCKIKYTFYAQDGSNVSAVVIGEGMDSGDKATNKAMSIAFKYACFQVFCIPTEDMIDPDSECHEVKPKEAPAENCYISAAELKKLTADLKTDGIPAEKIAAWYKVTTLENLTKTQHDNLRRNWAVAIEKAKGENNG